MDAVVESAPRRFGDVLVTRSVDHVAVVELQRPPDNPVDTELIRSLADAFEHLEGDIGCRAIVLCSAGKHFSAGARLGPGNDAAAVAAELDQNPLYEQAVRLFRGSVPIVAAVQGAAIGAGFGLALVADVRVTAPESRFAVNFSRLGFHPGFGISVLLPRCIGEAAALDLLYTGRRFGGEEAVTMGLCGRLAPTAEVRQVARAWAAEIAGSAPLSLRAIRQTMRGDVASLVEAATLREHAVQRRLRSTDDYAEGVQAYAERRPPEFTAR
jgi:2-(1,2-epoxy-1,2-dihydrophenyl)acetyl-CoA isomerase